MSEAAQAGLGGVAGVWPDDGVESRMAVAKHRAIRIGSIVVNSWPACLLLKRISDQ